MARRHKLPEAPAPELHSESTAPHAPEAPAPELVAMVKDGEVLEVHPTCVEAHKSMRWKILE